MRHLYCEHVGVKLNNINDPENDIFMFIYTLLTTVYIQYTNATMTTTSTTTTTLRVLEKVCRNVHGR